MKLRFLGLFSTISSHKWYDPSSGCQVGGSELSPTESLTLLSRTRRKSGGTYLPHHGVSTGSRVGPPPPPQPPWCSLGCSSLFSPNSSLFASPFSLPYLSLPKVSQLQVCGAGLSCQNRLKPAGTGYTWGHSRLPSETPQPHRHPWAFLPVLTETPQPHCHLWAEGTCSALVVCIPGINWCLCSRSSLLFTETTEASSASPQPPSLVGLTLCTDASPYSTHPSPHLSPSFTKWQPLHYKHCPSFPTTTFIRFHFR